MGFLRLLTSLVVLTFSFEGQFY